MSYYNTINLNGADLKKSTVRAESQTEKILRFFLAHRGESYTPIKIWRNMGESFLLTSVRRSMSDLTKAGDLIKKEITAQECFGSANYKWMLNEKKHPRQLKIF